MKTWSKKSAFFRTSCALTSPKDPNITPTEQRNNKRKREKCKKKDHVKELIEDKKTDIPV